MTTNEMMKLTQWLEAILPGTVWDDLLYFIPQYSGNDPFISSFVDIFREEERKIDEYQKRTKEEF